MSTIILLIFIISVFFASYKANKARNNSNITFIEPKSLNWFLVAFSAGTTANTGFIVTSAIAMGWTMGLSSIIFPLSFLLGDLFYWQFFAPRIHTFASNNNVKTIPELITSNLIQNVTGLKKFISLCIILSAIMYTIAQWSAAGKVFSGFYNFETTLCIVIFALIVLAYSLVGGFLSSVYADIVQGTFMLLLATITTLFCLFQIKDFGSQFAALFANFKSGFSLLSQNGLVFIIGWALASIGFSFSQPHVLDKVIAAKNENTVKKARYVYMFFVQYTWIGMTFLGILIKMLYTDLQSVDGETVLAKFLSLNSNEYLKGFVISGVFATIASTASSLNISIANYINNDILSKSKKYNNRAILILVFLLTVLPSVIFVNQKVFDLTIFAVSLGAVLASSILIKIFNFGHNKWSLISCLAISLATTILFKYLGWSANILYDIPVGTTLGLLTNYTVYKATN